MEQLEQRQLTTTAFVPLDAPWERAVNFGPAGDFNNDGFDDYLAIFTDGNEFQRETFETRVRLYLGGDDGLSGDRFRDVNDEHDISFVKKPQVILDNAEVTQFHSTGDGVRVVLRTDEHPERFLDPESFVDVVDVVWSDQAFEIATRDEPFFLLESEPAGTDFDGNGLSDRIVFVDGVGGVEHSLTPGDANGDLIVDFKDFLILADNYGSSDAGFFKGDFDGDGSVGFSDFLALAINFGR